MPSEKHPQATVLVVDDNTALVENLSEILEEAGYTAKAAGGVHDALKVARTGFDIALVDLQLPDGRGTWVAEQLKQMRPDCEVVLLTGFASVESAQAAIRTGACAYLVKPCATPELLLTVGQALRQVQRQAEKKELAHRAATAEKLAAVGTLTAGLSHEIRNPLNSASLQLSLLERRIRKLSPEMQGPLLEPLTLVGDEIRRLNHTLEDFLQFARPQAFATTLLDVKEITERTALFLQGDAEKRGVTLEAQCAEADKIAGEEGRLRQVLMNLTINALDAAGRGGKVRLGVWPEGRGVLLTIEDSGPGIPPDLQDRIFEPFFTTKPQGSGLGLPIVHAIVTQHGGTISVSRSALGGASFAIRLPPAA